MNKRRITLGLTAVLLVALALPAQALPGGIRRVKNTTVPIRTDILLEALDCSNTGTTIQLGASHENGPASMKVFLAAPSDKGNGDRVATGMIDLDVVPTAGSGDGVPKQGSAGGVGGNPWIFLKKDDGGFVLLGRCVQGFKTQWSEHSTIPVRLSATLKSKACNPKNTQIAAEDPAVEVLADTTNTIELVLDHARDSSKKAPRTPSDGSVTMTVQVTGLRIVGQPSAKSGLGGNPLVFGEDETPDPNADLPGYEWKQENYLGRCKDLLG